MSQHDYFDLQRECSAVVEPPQINRILKQNLTGLYKETIIPPGVSTRAVWGPILFKYCYIHYNKETNRLEIKEEELEDKLSKDDHGSEHDPGTFLAPDRDESDFPG